MIFGKREWERPGVETGGRGEKERRKNSAPVSSSKATTTLPCSLAQHQFDPSSRVDDSGHRRGDTRASRDTTKTHTQRQRRGEERRSAAGSTIDSGGSFLLSHLNPTAACSKAFKSQHPLLLCPSCGSNALPSTCFPPVLTAVVGHCIAASSPSSAKDINSSAVGNIDEGVKEKEG